MNVCAAKCCSPLFERFSNDFFINFRMILDRGCSLDVADVEGDTVLHLAARRENNELLAALLRKGANPDIKNQASLMLVKRTRK